MSAWTNIESLSTTIASNDPNGDAEDAILIDDYFRAAAGLLRQSVSAGSDIASASTITPPSTCNSFNLTGTTTVTAIASTNSWDGRIIWIRHTGAHQFTHSSTLYCLGAASHVFAANDISAWRQRSSGTWDMLFVSRAAEGSLPVSTTTTTAVLADRGKINFLTAGLTIPASVFAAGDVLLLVNDSASSITITQGSSLTMRFSGTTSTGNRTLAARGECTVKFKSATEAYITGAGLS